VGRPEQRDVNGRGGAVGDADRAGLEGWGRPFGEGWDEIPAWPPGPTDTDAWARVIATRPDLAPAIGGRLGVPFVEWMMGFPEGWVDVPKASRRQQLSALGNAVVWPQALLAWRMLTS
jgi:hypothetical protein